MTRLFPLLFVALAMQSQDHTLGVGVHPGERRSITTELRDADTRGEKPRILAEGFNLAGRQ